MNTEEKQRLIKLLQTFGKRAQSFRTVGMEAKTKKAKEGWFHASAAYEGAMIELKTVFPEVLATGNLEDD